MAPVGISHEERDGFPPSPQRALSQTWPLSPPDLTLKWACKEYVLEHGEKTTRLKTPKRGNKNPYVHLITAAVSVFSSQLSTVYSTKLCLMTNCIIWLVIYSSPSVFFNSDWQLPTPPDISSHLPTSRLCLWHLHRAGVVFSNWPSLAHFFESGGGLFVFCPCAETTERLMPQSLCCRIWRGVCLWN